jgi:hypothetical protein
MNPIQHIRRLATALAGLAGALLAFAAAAPAALARADPPLPPGWQLNHPLPLGNVVGPVYQVPAHTVVAGGMPGWQIALIAAAAALAAATVAVLLDRARAAGRARRTRIPRRRRRARGLPAVEALRVLTVRGGGRP